MKNSQLILIKLGKEVLTMEEYVLYWGTDIVEKFTEIFKQGRVIVKVFMSTMMPDSDVTENLLRCELS